MVERCDVGSVPCSTAPSIPFTAVRSRVAVRPAVQSRRRAATAEGSTMSTSNERALKTIDEMAEREQRERRESLQRALDRGGMPSEAEFLNAEAKLRDAFNTLEDLGIRLRGISKFAGCGGELPFDVTSEQIGLVAGFVCMLTADVDECRQ